MRNQGRIVARDTSAARLKLLAENCARLGVTCVEIRHVPSSIRAAEAPTPAEHEPEETSPETSDAPSVTVPADASPADALAAPTAATATAVAPSPPASAPGPDSGELFDRVLLDAPCSNTGVLRRRLDLRWRLRPEEIERLQHVQLRLLREAAQCVRPGGVLVYSTCSLEREENQQVVEQFLAERRDFALDRERELLPFNDRVDGAYVARLIRA
jgi:16S rRNA C967 or C1407 C5-methylase (RsmB/RsmF family)